MLKFLLILFLIGYVVFKLVGFLFRVFFVGYYHQQAQQSQKQSTSGAASGYARKPADGNVQIDYVPEKQDRKPQTFKGGEYVDYEEVK